MAFKVNTNDLTKPSAFDNTPLEDGLHEVKVEKCEYTTSSTGNLMLKLQYKTMDGGRLIFDQIMDDPTKAVNGYRLGRLLAALDIELEGEVELKDMPKIIKQGMPLVVAIVTKPGSQFTNIDINQHEGYYPFEAVAAPKTIAPKQKQDVQLEVAEEDELVEITEVDETY